MNNQEIFTSEERNENEERKRELIELVVSGEAVLIVGAGSSARVGYVTWNGLMQELEDLASQYDDFEKDEEKRVKKPLEYAEDIKAHIRDKTGDVGRYYALLEEIFEPKTTTHDEFHRLLVDLPFRGILTTNYDIVLEAALSRKKDEAEHEGRQIRPIDVMPLVIGPDTPRLIHEFLLARNNDPHIPQRIAHLHGLYRYRESIILSSEDYVEKYGLRVKQTGEDQGNEDRWTFHRKLLWAILATRRVVFVGFSMEDPYFNKMLEIVGNDLWVWNKSIHFAIMSITSSDVEDSQAKAERLNSEYGVSTVFYEDSDNLHQGLIDIISEIYVACGDEGQSTLMSGDWSHGESRSEGEEPEPTRRSRDILDWVKQVTQRTVRRIRDEN